MLRTYTLNFIRGAGLAGIVTGFVLAAGPDADAAPRFLLSQGYAARSALNIDLHRGAVVPPEATVIATPDGCGRELELDIDWNERANRVRVRLRGREALPPDPQIDREPGVDYFENPFYPEPEDVESGRYQLWITGAAGPMTSFYYDPHTYALLGGGPDFVPLPGSIVHQFPTLYALASPQFEPNSRGDVRLDWSFSYARPARGDQPQFSYQMLAFVPPDLCHYDRFRPDLSTLRAWTSDPVPVADARPWSEFLAGGLMFSVTVEPDDPDDPLAPTLIHAHSNTTVVGGAIPPKWTLLNDAAQAGVAPFIGPWPGAGRCEAEFAGFHTGVDVCTAG